MRGLMMAVALLLSRPASGLELYLDLGTCAVSGIVGRAWEMYDPFEFWLTQGTYLRLAKEEIEFDPPWRECVRAKDPVTKEQCIGSRRSYYAAVKRCLEHSQRMLRAVGRAQRSN